MAESPSAGVGKERLTFIVAGGQRCGSSWIDAALRGHPEIFLPAKKQSHFFDVNFAKGVDWYLERFAEAPAGAKAVGEVATNYCLPEAADRLGRTLPHVRVILNMRHPVERTYSAYLVGKAGRDWKCFEDALDARPDLLARGRYGEQIEVLLRHYPREQLLLSFYDDLDADPAGFLAQILRFLEVDDTWRSPLLGRTVNAGMFPRARKTLNAVGLAPVLRVLSRSSFGDAVRTLKKRSAKKGYAPMRPETRQRLLDHFAPHNEALEKLCGRDLSAWSA